MYDGKCMYDTLMLHALTPAADDVTDLLVAIVTCTALPFFKVI